MFDILTIDESVRAKCESLMSPDTVENLSRSQTHGVAAIDGTGEAKGLIVWMVKHGETEDKTESELIDFGGDGQALEELIGRYNEETGAEAVRSFFERPDMEEDQQSAFSNAGFNIEEREGRCLTITVGELDSLKVIKAKVSKAVIGIGELQELQFFQGVTNCMFHGQKGLMEDLGTMSRAWYDVRTSCAVKADGKIKGFFLVHKTPSGALYPVLFAAMGPDSKIHLLEMLAYAAVAAKDNYPPETKIIIDRHNKQIRDLVSYLLPGKKGENVFAGERRKEVSL